ncbi:zinc finger protein 37-like [Odontomachus brunneus]|uniref:zinc finger protein 37-like n=1 Tax=Odontomachus brunneus TaxID=486640 RepID=UPI0013F28B5C|nr:zinc finger protein 37-like [Odontomachus brunneus]XP_032662676.1 zinc finger protein 37-like [Odontomachus brunneus]
MLYIYIYIYKYAYNDCGIQTRLMRSLYQCNTCGKMYKWRESLSLHKRMECGIEPRFACNVCGRKFKHKHHLMKHYKSIHGRVVASVTSRKMTIGCFPCRKCGKIYDLKSSMYTHVRCCGKEPRFTCHFCSRKFKYKHHLQNHIIALHRNVMV